MSDQNSTVGPYCICRSFDDSRFMICCDRCNQWFHGDCVRLKAEEAKKITHFYCPPCQKANPALQTLYDHSKGSPSSSYGFAPFAGAPSILKHPPVNPANSAVAEKREAAPETLDVDKTAESLAKRSKLPPDVPNCGNCIGCFRKGNCGRCDACKRGNPDGELCLLRRCVNANTTSAQSATKESAQMESDEEGSYGDRRKRLGTGSRSNAKLKNVSPRKYGGKVGRPPKQRSQNTSSAATSGGTRSSARAYRKFLKDAGVLPNSEDEAEKYWATPRQCYGPGCIYAARRQSKYCSDECGMKLAQLRIQELLPSRLQQWYLRRPVAEDFEEKRLERIRNEHDVGRARLADLDNEERELHAWRERCKNMRLKENEGGKGNKSKKDQHTSDDPETSVYCFTCGNETSMKNAIKHFSKCFAKYESQTSYGSAFKAVNNLYNIFCDTYNKTNRTYCKRLRVICPEHSKDPKVETHEICGAPLQPDKRLKVADLDASAVCTILKKNCIKHYKWLQIRRALIDMERLSQLLRLEELSEETRCIRLAQNSRGSLLGLLLHHTVSHEEEPKKTEKECGDKMEDETREPAGDDDGEARGSVEDAGQ